MKQKIILLSLITLTLCQNPIFLNTNSNWAEQTLQKLTLREKIGQLFIVATASNFTQPTEILVTALQNCPYNMNHDHIINLIKNYNIGGVIFLFKSDPNTQVAFTNKYQELSKVPLLITQDSEWGLSMRLDLNPEKVIQYPRNLTLGAIKDEQLIYELGKEVGHQCSAIGIHMNFAPVVDINNNPENPVIHDRSFGDDKYKVARLATLFAQGVEDAGILACAKHFPGHGDTDVDSHLELPIIKHDKVRLDNIELYPFRHIINNGISSIMIAHLAIPALEPDIKIPSSLSYKIVTEELKNNLNFKGLIITDGLGMQAITNHYKPGELELQAFLAGNDILLCPLDVPLAIELIEKAILSGRITEEELDRRVLKILKAKEHAFKQNAKTNFEAFIIRQEAKELQEKLFDNAVTLVKNEKNLNFNQKLLEESCLIQIGDLPENLFFNSLDGICKKALCIPKKFNINQIIENTSDHNTIIIALAQMNKFAKDNFGISTESLALINKLLKNKQVILVVFGSPYSLKYFENCDVVIEAYEDAPAMQSSVLKVLKGHIQATGSLPIKI